MGNLVPGPSVARIPDRGIIITTEPSEPTATNNPDPPTAMSVISCCPDPPKTSDSIRVQAIATGAGMAASVVVVGAAPVVSAEAASVFVVGCVAAVGTVAGCSTKGASDPNGLRATTAAMATTTSPAAAPAAFNRVAGSRLTW
ncbi:MAG: hypothetical protein P1T08_05735 [Acidimicrobiia bacterium]|nr:hypothetical protein [Acidimicrobiia bacterium]